MFESQDLISFLEIFVDIRLILYQFNNGDKIPEDGLTKILNSFNDFNTSPEFITVLSSFWSFRRICALKKTFVWE